MAKQKAKLSRESKSSIVMFAINLATTMRRDAVELAAIGINSAAIDHLKTLATALSMTTDDEYYRADVLIQVEEKNLLRNELVLELRMIVSIAKIKWGRSSAQVERFGMSKFLLQSDSAFLTTCRRVHQTGSEYLSELSSFGLTQSMLDSLEMKADSFKQKLFDISEMKERRALKTAERIEKMNELYSLAAHYCMVGKIIWQDVDEAKYNDYLIYKYMGRKKKRKKKKDSE